MSRSTALSSVVNTFLLALSLVSSFDLMLGFAFFLHPFLVVLFRFFFSVGSATSGSNNGSSVLRRLKPLGSSSSMQLENNEDNARNPQISQKPSL